MLSVLKIIYKVASSYWQIRNMRMFTHLSKMNGYLEVVRNQNHLIELSAREKHYKSANPSCWMGNICLIGNIRMFCRTDNTRLNAKKE